MLGILLKMRLRSLSARLFRSGLNRKKSRGHAVLMGILFLYLAVCLLGAMGMMFAGIAGTLIPLGLDWLYFAMAGLTAFAFCVVGSIFMTQSQLFDAKDNELLLSMPIRPGYILASRILSILLLTYVYSYLFLIPAMVVYFLFAPFSLGVLLCMLLASLLLPLLALAVTCLCGYVVALISSRLKHKNLIVTVLLLGFFFGYMYLCMNLTGYMNYLILHGSELAGAFQNALPPLYHFGMAASGHPLNILWLLLWCVLPMALIYWVLSKGFIRISTAKKTKNKAVYREKAVAQRSPLVALYRKELQRFFSTPMYIFNCGIGSVMTLVAAVFLLIKRNDLLALMTQSEWGVLLPFLSPLIVGALCVLATMNQTTAPSISLEGKSLWIIRSSPVFTRSVFFSKLLVNLTIGLPVLLIAAGIVLWTFPLDALSVFYALVIPTLCQVFVSLFGLVSNLLFPRLDFLSETSVIKQSGSVFLATFGSMAGVLLPILGFFWLGSQMTMNLYLLICLLYFLMLCIACIWFLETKGRRIFESL